MSDKPTLNDVLERLLQIGQDVAAIRDHLGAVPNVNGRVEVSALHDVAGKYEVWLAKARPNMSQKDRDSRVNVVIDFLTGSDGMITPHTVETYLGTLETTSKRNLALKTLRPFCRDYLSLGPWISKFEFERVETARKTKPVDKASVNAVSLNLRDAGRASGDQHANEVWLALYFSGLRVGEILALPPGAIDQDTGALDASDVHAGKTKKAAVSFVPVGLARALVESKARADPHYKTVYTYTWFKSALDKAMRASGVSDLTPKDLRRNFADACREAGLDSDLIDVLQGRAPKSVLARHYTTTGLKTIRKHWLKVADVLAWDKGPP